MAYYGAGSAAQHLMLVMGEVCSMCYPRASPLGLLLAKNELDVLFLKGVFARLRYNLLEAYDEGRIERLNSFTAKVT